MKNDIEDITTRVIKMINNIIQIEQFHITSESKLIDLNINSLQFIQFIVNIEEEFDIEFSDSFLIMDEISSVRKIVEQIYEEIN